MIDFRLYSVTIGEGAEVAEMKCSTECCKINFKHPKGHLGTSRITFVTNLLFGSAEETQIAILNVNRLCCGTELFVLCSVLHFQLLYHFHDIQG